MRLTKYPLELNSQNKLILSEDPGSELELFLKHPVNRRAFDKSYGLDTKFLQQSSTDPKVYIPIFSMELRQKLRRYIKNVTLLSARIFKDSQQRRKIFIEVNYKIKDNVEKKQTDIDI